MNTTRKPGRPRGQFVERCFSLYKFLLDQPQPVICTGPQLAEAVVFDNKKTVSAQQIAKYLKVLVEAGKINCEVTHRQFYGNWIVRRKIWVTELEEQI